MKTLIQWLAILVITLNLISCSKDDPSPAPPNPNITFLAALNGTSEVPANASTATGTSTLTFNNNTKIFTISTSYTGMTVTNAHIHKGAVGVSGPPVFAFTTFASPITYTSAALDAAQEADLKAGLFYVNLHSAAFAGGEIRGQLIMQ